MSKAELADFLRRRREGLRPEETAATRRARRTPGLRREEVAERAGVSANYYERLEQARGPWPSTQVVAALGGALRLTPPEVEHLARLAGLAPNGEAGIDGTSRADGVPADARRMLDRLGPIPAYLVDEHQDVVAWNRPADALFGFAALPAAERNIARMSVRLRGSVCSEPVADSGEFARAFAAELRVAGARHPGDRAIGEMVNAYAAHSPDFVAGWRSHDVRPRPVLRKHLSHPEVGELDLEHHTLVLPGTELRLIMYTAEPGSPSAAALARL